MPEQYLVSARKYRPATFDTVVGQSHITTTLKNAIKNNHLAHAYLFCGPRGVGKTTCARILAKTINCEHPTAEMEACGTCDTCKNFSENNAFNVIELDAASNNSVDDIRALNEQVRYAPQVGKYKIYIIDEVHMLSTAAFNAFLKTLEEPPSYAIFILATTEKHKILPTILSRCQIFDFKRIQTDDIVPHLQSICEKESTKAEESALHIIARKSEGCMRDALSIMDRIANFTNNDITYKNTLEHLNMLDEDLYFQMTDALLIQDYNSVLLMLDDVLLKGFEGNVVLNGLQEHLRNLLLSKEVKMAKLLDISEHYKKQYFEKAQSISEAFILTAMKMLNDAEVQYNQAVNKRLHTELCFIKLANIANAIQLSTLIQDEGLKKKLVEQPNNAPQVTTTISEAESSENITEKNTETTNVVTEKSEQEESYKKTSNTTISESTQASQKGKFGKHLLADLKSQNQEALAEEKQTVTLDQNSLDKYITEFINNLEPGKDLLKNHLLATTFTLVDELTIQAVSYSYVQFNSLKNCSSALNEYFVNITHQSHLKVQTILDESKIVEDENIILTKNELFEQLTEQIPIVESFTKELGMRVSASYQLTESDKAFFEHLKTQQNELDNDATEDTENDTIEEDNLEEDLDN